MVSNAQNGSAAWVEWPQLPKMYIYIAVALAWIYLWNDDYKLAAILRAASRSSNSHRTVECRIAKLQLMLLLHAAYASCNNASVIMQG